MVTIAPSHLPMSVQPYERGETRGSFELLANETCRGIGIGRSNGGGSHVQTEAFRRRLLAWKARQEDKQLSISDQLSFSARPVAARRRQ